MPKMSLNETFEMETRNKYTKVECVLAISINGRELPNMSVVGEALEKAIELIEDAVKKSYEVVPPRDVDQTNVVAQPAPVQPVAQPVPAAVPRPSTSAFD
jgi:hypothetical protein